MALVSQGASGCIINLDGSLSVLSKVGDEVSDCRHRWKAIVALQGPKKRHDVGPETQEEDWPLDPPKA
eukprot:CAMPEP_0181493688 /NCGR_PEP_ID=MMETSP1110-20121109/51357_1 /TAXON_ID=174948 /ORGANISM="Symbiodinium sp., Strain CCMP421" /LENGTH=67 /DNA_ID=CAMNT_0023621021 /DNA_START=414 /DNA_END=614 /DNA_ORIENTATION=+